MDNSEGQENSFLMQNLLFNDPHSNSNVPVKTLEAKWLPFPEDKIHEFSRSQCLVPEERMRGRWC